MKRLAAIALVVLSACKKTPEPEADAAPPATPTTEPPPSLAGDPAAPSAPRELPPVEATEAPVLTNTENAAGVGSAAPTPPADPFDGAVAGVRASAVGCFAGQPKGEYTATISVVVSPAGRATRVEASSSLNDAAVTKCLEQAASTRSYPSSNDGRKLSIDVRVKG